MENEELLTKDINRLIQQVRQGDEMAARELVEELYPLVIRIVRSHLPQRAAEEDLAQESFVKIFSRIDQYRPQSGTPFEHWVARVTVRTCLDGLRAERRRPELRWTDLSDSESTWMEYFVSDETTAPNTSAEEAREILERLMRELAPPDRLIIHLLDLEQKSVKEISAITGMNRTLIKVRAFRARRRLRQLGEQYKKKMCYEIF